MTEEEEKLYTQACTEVSEAINRMVELGGKRRGRQDFEDIMGAICADKFGVNPLSALDGLKADAFSKGTAYQVLNEGKALLISPFGFRINEQSVVKGKPTIIVLTEQLTFEDEHD